MKKIGFIGAFDKTDFIIYIAKILTTIGKKVIVIDSTLNQKAKYIVPVINPTTTYVTEYEGMDVAVGFDDFDKIKEYLSSAMGLIKGVVNIFIAIICSVYILAQRTRIVNFINRFTKAVLTKKGYTRFNKYFTEGNAIFFRYLSSQMLDGIVVAIITSIAMSLMGVRYSVLLGTLIGFSNLIPYFGAIFGVAIAIIITILTGGWQQALIMGIVVIVLQQLDANLINPRITSSSLKVSPLLIMFAVTVGGAYFGVLGMFLAAPVFTLIKVIVDDFVNERNREKDLASTQNNS